MSPLASGLAGQLGFAAESTYGTFVAPTRFLELTSSSVKYERERIESNGIRAGRRVLHRWAAGVQRAAGDVEFEMAPQGFALLWAHIIGGTDVITGSNPYTHTMSPGDLAGKSLSLQIGKPDVGGVVRVFSYLGCKVTGAELSCSAGEYAMMNVSFYGNHLDTSQALGTASYPANLTPFDFTKGTVTLAAAGFDVKEVSLSIDNGLSVDRHFLRTTTPERSKEPLESNRRNITGSMTADFTDLTALNRFINGTEAALVLTFNAGASAQTTITMNVRFDGEDPDLGQELLEQPLQFKAVSGTSDAAAFTVAVVNADVAS
jgi:hypothetical protein